LAGTTVANQRPRVSCKARPPELRNVVTVWTHPNTFHSHPTFKLSFPTIYALKQGKTVWQY
jgi:hypothetical protein